MKIKCDSGTPTEVRTLNTMGLGSKFHRMHGKQLGTCPTCGREVGLSSRGNLMPHKREVVEAACSSTT